MTYTVHSRTTTLNPSSDDYSTSNESEYSRTFKTITEARNYEEYIKRWDSPIWITETFIEEGIAA
jgi:hypothetical protein